MSLKSYPRQAGTSLKSLLIAALTAFATTSAHAQMPPNIDFSMSNFTNWKCWTGNSVTGTAATGPALSMPAVSGPIGGIAPGTGSSSASRHAITTGSDTDYYGGFKIVCPAGGSYSARVGNDNTGAQADRIQYTVHVPATSSSYNIQIQYAIVLLDAAHPAASQSSFQVVAYDSATNTVIPGANNLYIARYAIPGFQPFHNPVTGKIDSSTAWLAWTPSTVNLSGMGGKTVILECTAFDCTLGGHWGYGYLDVISAQDSLVASLISYSAAKDSATLLAPPGYKSYRWYNQNFTVAFNGPNDTARLKKLPTPSSTQRYNVVLTPYSSIGTPDTIVTSFIKAKTLGVQPDLLEGIKVYPNPANTALHLSFTAGFEGNVSLLNMAGENVYHTRISKAGNVDINTSGWASGIYSVVFSDDSGNTAVRKVVIQH